MATRGSDRRPLILLAAMVAMALIVSCCGFLETKEAKYKKYMECAERLTSDRSIELLHHGYACCEKLPPELADREAAKRFYLEKARALKPDSPEPYAAIGLSYWEGGDYPRALDAYQQAAKRTGKPFAYLIAEATMMRLCGRYDDAMNAADDIEKMRTVDGAKTAAYLRGRILYEKGLLKEARADFEKAIAMAEKSGYFLTPSPYTMVDAWFYLAQIRLKEGDPQGAYDAFKNYLSRMTNPEFQLWYTQKLLPRYGADQKGLYDAIEENWVSERQ